MHPRINVAKFLIKLGRFIQSTAVAVMRPDDLIEFSRRHYVKPSSVEVWCNEPMVASGLSTVEKLLLTETGLTGGRLLLLGLGGGREAIPLSKMGFKVTGVDFAPQMVEWTNDYAKRKGANVTCSVQEISRLEQAENEFDLAWLSAAMYSSVPTRIRRIDMLRRISRSIKPGGYFLFGFFWNPEADTSPAGILARKLIAWLTWGNVRYKKGDMLRFNNEFIHAFSEIDELNSEIRAGGFRILDTKVFANNEFAWAIAQKPV